jgi:hypothetical protein
MKNISIRNFCILRFIFYVLFINNQVYFLKFKYPYIYIHIHIPIFIFIYYHFIYLITSPKNIKLFKFQILNTG